MAVERTDLVCPVCAKDGKRVGLVRVGTYFAHGEGQRGRGCHVSVFAEAPKQPTEDKK